MCNKLNILNATIEKKTYHIQREKKIRTMADCQKKYKPQDNDAIPLNYWGSGDREQKKWST